MYSITLIDVLKLLSLVFPIYLLIYTIGIAIHGYSIFKLRYYYPLIIFFLIAYSGYGILFLIFGDRVLDIKMFAIVGAVSYIPTIWMKIKHKRGDLILNLGLVEEKGVYKRGILRSRILLHFSKNGICYSRDFFSWNKIEHYKWLGSPANILEFKVRSIMYPFPFTVVIPFQHLEEVEHILTTNLPNTKSVQA